MLFIVDLVRQVQVMRTLLSFEGRHFLFLEYVILETIMHYRVCKGSHKGFRVFLQLFEDPRTKLTRMLFAFDSKHDFVGREVIEKVNHCETSNRLTWKVVFSA